MKARGWEVTACDRAQVDITDRAAVPEVMTHFDFATPDMPTGRRYNTIVPQQALFMMNSPLVVEQAKNLTLRPDFKAARGAQEKIKLLYKLKAYDLETKDDAP